MMAGWIAGALMHNLGAFVISKKAFFVVAFSFSYRLYALELGWQQKLSGRVGYGVL